MAMTRQEAVSALARVREKYPQYGNISDTELSQKLAARYTQYKPIADAISTPQYAVPDYMTRVLEEGGVEESERTRLLNTGITPGTAAQWAAAHIQMNKARKGEVSEAEQKAIFDLYKRQSGRTDLSSQDFFQSQRQKELEARRETVGGRLIDAAAGYEQNLANTGLDILGAVAPETANRLAEDVDIVYGTDQDSRAAAIGGFVAEVPKLYAAAGTGPLGMAVVYGTQGVGGTRREIADLRQQGAEISGLQEATSAALIGSTEAISGYVGGKIFGAMAPALQSLSPTLKAALSKGDEGAARHLVRQLLTLSGEAFAEGSEEALTQIVTNGLRQGYNPEVALLDGVKEAFAAGALLAPIGAAGMTGVGESRKAVDTDAAVIQQNQQKALGITQTVPEDATKPKTPEQRDAAPKDLYAVSSEVAKADPDVIESTEAAEPMTEFFAGQARESFENPNGPYVKVDVPLDLIDVKPEYQQDVRDQYAQRPADTAPAGLAGIGKGGDKFVIVDGNTRVHAARQRGDTTIKMWVPEADAYAHDLQGEAEKYGDRRAAELHEERNQIQALFSSGNVVEAQQRIAVLQDRARRDPKGTGLLSGQMFTRDMDAAQKEANKTKQSRYFSVLDVANLGLSNTVKGHQGADTDLQRVADAVKEVAGPEASYRTGGDEQGILWPPGTTREEADAMLTQIEEKVGFEQLVPGASLFVAGATGEIKPGGTIQSAMQEAEEISEARKKSIKKTRGEKTSITKDKAAKLAKRLNKGNARAKAATPIEGTVHKRRIPQAVEDWITPLSSRIRDLSPRMFDRIMRMEFNTALARERLKKELHAPAARLQSALRQAKKSDDFKYYVLNQQFAEAEALIHRLNPDLQADFNEFVSVFKNLLDNQRAAGVTIGQLDHYWPRFIKDYKAFKAEFGADLGSFEEAWELARQVKKRRILTAAEKAEIANTVLQGYGPHKPGSFGPPNARKRRVDKVSREALTHYVDPFEAAFRYIDGATYAAERARFLGRNHSLDQQEETIGALIAEEVSAGRLDTSQQEELHDLLSTRFTADMMTTSKAVRTFKQLVYLTTLGQFRSTLTQLTDVAITASQHGLLATGKGTLATLRLTPRDKRFIMEDIGVHDHGEEFKDIGKIARSTDWTLRKTGFKMLDRLGKESRINAAWSAMKRAAARPSGKEYGQLERAYKPVFGDVEFGQVMRDLREGKKTENVKYLLFLDITKIQPLTTSQMPKKYLDMPNGRIMYSLKTFTLMQLDHVRRDMVRKIATPGQRREGLSHLARYITLFTLVGLGVDFLKAWMRGEEVNADTIPDHVVDSLLGTVGMNRYTVERAWTKPSEAALNYVAPPLSWMDAAWQDVSTGGNGGLRSIRNIPIVGELLFYWAPFGRGYQMSRDKAKTDYRKALTELRVEAAEALRHGDQTLARDLVAVYNERRKQGPGDGRKTPLTFENLRGDIEQRQSRERKESING